MSDLHPTPTRLALLRAVAAGEVHEDTFRAPYKSHHGRDNVTARIDDLYRAGWISFGEPAARWRRAWQLTDAGRAVLEAAVTR